MVNARDRQIPASMPCGEAPALIWRVRLVGVDEQEEAFVPVRGQPLQRPIERVLDAALRIRFGRAALDPELHPPLLFIKAVEAEIQTEVSGDEAALRRCPRSQAGLLKHLDEGARESLAEPTPRVLSGKQPDHGRKSPARVADHLVEAHPRVGQRVQRRRRRAVVAVAGDVVGPDGVQHDENRALKLRRLRCLARVLGPAAVRDQAEAGEEANAGALSAYHQRKRIIERRRRRGNPSAPDRTFYRR